jgi:hypothetical protein
MKARLFTILSKRSNLAQSLDHDSHEELLQKEIIPAEKRENKYPLVLFLVSIIFWIIGLVFWLYRPKLGNLDEVCSTYTSQYSELYNLIQYLGI